MGQNDRINRTHIAHTHVTRTHTGAYTYGRTHTDTHTRTKCNETMYKRKNIYKKLAKFGFFAVGVILNKTSLNN